LTDQTKSSSKPNGGDITTDFEQTNGFHGLSWARSAEPSVISWGCLLA